ncbi:MAG: hypothetical protein E4H14_05920 [Candidatus Thorarchaeota archaeon]|nr:MAG: hypothetical protein E4H14_05920 [Candidatus Thorarchaeota archaeon]
MEEYLLNTKSMLLALLMMNFLLPYPLYSLTPSYDSIETEILMAKADNGILTKLDSISSYDMMNAIVYTRESPTALIINELEHNIGPIELRDSLHLMNAILVQLSKDQLIRLLSDPLVEGVSSGGDYEPFIDDARSYSHIEELYDSPYNLDGSGVTIALVDTGVYPEHNSLNDGQIIGFVDFGYESIEGSPTEPISIDFEAPFENANDDTGHGTAMASIIAGSGDGSTNQRFHGVAPGASLICIRIQLDADTGDDYDNFLLEEWSILRAFDWIITNKNTYGIDIVSCSFGSYSVEENGNMAYNYLEADPPDRPEQRGDFIAQKADQMVANGLVVVVAAGNAGTQYQIATPASAKNVITVGALSDPSSTATWARWLHPDDPLIKCSGTSVGPVDYWDLSPYMKPDIMAPGVDIWCASIDPYNPWQPVTGTSPATAFTAGLIALYLEVDSTLNQDWNNNNYPDVKDVLRTYAVDIDEDIYPGADGYYGWGRIDGLEGIDIIHTDAGRSKFDPLYIGTPGDDLDAYVRFNEPLWYHDMNNNDDWYKFVIPTNSYIWVGVWINTDLKIQIQLIRYNTVVRTDSSAYYGDDCYVQYTGYGTFYLQVKLTGGSIGFYQIRIMASPSGVPPHLP